MHVKDWFPQKGYKVLTGEGVAPWKKILAGAEKTGESVTTGLSRKAAITPKWRPCSSFSRHFLNCMGKKTRRMGLLGIRGHNGPQLRIKGGKNGIDRKERASV
jgi:hypothetical protein